MAIWKPFSVATMSRQMKDEEKIMREKMIQKIRNQTMGDVMFEHLKDSFGAELKVKDIMAVRLKVVVVGREAR